MTLLTASERVQAFTASFDRIGDYNVASIIGLALILSGVFAAHGYRQYFNYDGKVYTLQTNGKRSVRVSAEKLLDVVRAVTLDVAHETTSSTVAPAARRARATVTAIESKTPGQLTYLRELVTEIRDRLPEATDEERDALLLANPRENRSEYIKAWRESRAEARDTEARELIGKWADRLPVGRHPLPELWAAFSDALAASRKLPEDHGARLIGKNRFYAALDAHGRIVTGGQRRRFYVVPEAVAA